MTDKKVLMVHFRVGKTDGVSIEMKSWKEILEQMGAEVRYCAGNHSIGADYTIDNLEQQLNDTVFYLDQDAFGGLKYFKSEDIYIENFEVCVSSIENEFREVINDFHPTDILISNIFSVGEGLPAAKAILKVLDEYETNTILVNHDFFWEENRFKKPSMDYIAKHLRKYLTPKRDYIQHCTINSIGQRTLKEDFGIESTLFHDTFDYGNNAWKRSPRITSFLKKHGIDENTLIFLQATRVVRRKNIELSIDFVKEFKELLDGPSSTHLPHNRFLLLLTGYVERRDEYYLRLLLSYAEEANVDILYIGDELHREYELFDIYPYADTITFPSEYEGFGNQLLEAFNAQKPVVLFEYPVYLDDIKPRGFDTISLGHDLYTTTSDTGLKCVERNTNRQAAKDLLALLSDKARLQEMVTHNYNLAQMDFGYNIAQQKLRKLLQC